MEDFEEISKIVYTASYTLPICDIKVTVQRWGGHYEENGDYIKAYFVIILMNNFKTNPFDTLLQYLDSQPFARAGWEPSKEKNGVINYSHIVNGFENVKPHINDFLIKIANFKQD